MKRKIKKIQRWSEVQVSHVLLGNQQSGKSCFCFCAFNEVAERKEVIKKGSGAASSRVSEAAGVKPF